MRLRFVAHHHLAVEDAGRAPYRRGCPCRARWTGAVRQRRGRSVVWWSTCWLTVGHVEAVERAIASPPAAAEAWLRIVVTRSRLRAEREPKRASAAMTVAPIACGGDVRGRGSRDSDSLELDLVVIESWAPVGKRDVGCRRWSTIFRLPVEADDSCSIDRHLGCCARPRCRLP